MDDEKIALAEGLSDLDRRLHRAVANGRGIMLAAHELDLMAEIGALQQFHVAAGEAIQSLAADRNAKRRGAIVPSTSNFTPEPMPSVLSPPKQASRAEAVESLARAKRACLPTSKRRGDRAKT